MSRNWTASSPSVSRSCGPKSSAQICTEFDPTDCYPQISNDEVPTSAPAGTLAPDFGFRSTASSEGNAMAGETTITLVGNLTADPELRFTPSGAAVANFTVASTPRIYDRQSGEWKDGEALFLRCNIWREAAENVAESLTRGSRVIVQGRLKQRSFETREGEKRTVVEVEVDEIGPSLRYATAKVNKASRSGGGGGGFGGGGGSRAAGSGGGSEAKQDDPWGSAPASGSFSGGDDEPP